MPLIKEARVFHDGYSFHTDLDQISLPYGVEELDETTFGDNTRTAVGGLETVGLAYNGFWAGGSGSVDEVLQADVATKDVPITVSMNAANDGDTAYFSRYLWASFTPFDSATVGDSHRFAGDASGRGDPLVRGSYLHNATVTSSGTGTAVQEGSVGSSESLYAVLHVVSSSGDGSQTLDVKVQSDSGSGFSGSTDRITFSQFTTSVGSEWATPVAGSISDDYWRVDYTVGGTGSPSFQFIVAIGIR